MAPALLTALVLAAALGADERFDQLETELRGRDQRARRSAVIELAKLGTSEAWRAVIGVLADPVSQVADEAQIQIAAIAEEPGRALLFGKDALASRNDLVRERVVESFARMAAAPPYEILLQPLKDKSVGVRRTGAWTLERLARSGKLATLLESDQAGLAKTAAGLLQAADKEKDDEARAALLVAAGLVTEAFDGQSLSALAADKRAAVRAAALILARQSTDEVALALTAATSGDKALGVRLNAAETLAQREGKPALLALVESFAAERESIGRWRMLELLRARSGQKLGMNVEAWRAWSRALPDDWSGGASEGDQAGEEENRTLAFAGLTLRSAHVAFLIDLSGSVWERGKGDRTKKEVIDEELTQALRALPPETEFNIIPYTLEPHPWQKGLVRADARNVEKAIEFFVGCRDSGTGNLWDALLLALEDPKVDTLVVLTDGAPSGGARWNLGLMKELFTERNRFRRVVLEAILADAPGNLKAHWRAMCGASGGRVLEVDLR